MQLRLGLCFLFWLAGHFLNAQIISHKLYYYDDQQVYKTQTRITISDSLKFEGKCLAIDDCQGWQHFATFKIDKTQKYKSKVLYFFTNNGRSHLILEHQKHERYILIRNDTNYHRKHLIVAYYEIYDQI